MEGRIKPEPFSWAKSTELLCAEVGALRHGPSGKTLAAFACREGIAALPGLPGLRQSIGNELIECRAFQTVEVLHAQRRLLKNMLGYFKRRDRSPH